MKFGSLDLMVLLGYLFIMIGIAVWLAFKDKNENAKDYFLASGALPWWAVGGSLIASNISTEQILGMNGSGYVMGLAIAAYELLAAITLILVAKFLLPVFIKEKIYTMPQFLEVRYSRGVRTIMAFFWIVLFIVVNLTSVLYLGALAIESILPYDIITLHTAIIGLVIYSLFLSVFGGLKAVVWTDVLQVIILVIGGFVAAYTILDFVGAGDVFAGLSGIYESAPGHFDMILDKTNPSYDQLPGIGVLFGGMWIANIYYWGNNQYIIQRALGAKDLKEAQRGVAFAAVIKLFIPIFAVIPGIAAFVILRDPAAYGFTGEGISANDEAFPWVLNNFVHTGFKGLVLAALIAAIGSSVSSMVNSTSTIFTLDIYKNMLQPDRSEKHYVTVGRIAAIVALCLGALLAPLLQDLGQVFQYIQEYTGFISPGVLAVFLFGIFWKRASANSALVAIALSIPLSAFLAYALPEMPFLIRMAACFTLLTVVIFLVSIIENKSTSRRNSNGIFVKWLIFAMCIISVPSGLRILAGDVDLNNSIGILILGVCGLVFAGLLMERKEDDDNAIELDSSLFKTETVFNLCAAFICLVLFLIYFFLW